MSPKSKSFSRKDIINAAFEVVRKRGREKLSARTVARVMNSSTMPIYSYMQSMKKLEEELAYKASELLYQYQTTRRTGHTFLDMGIGYVIFAREECHLFRYMFMTEHSARDLQDRRFDTDLNTLIEKMGDDQTLEGLDKQQMQKILEKMWIFVHGLATLLSFGVFEHDSEEYIIELIRQTGGDVIRGEMKRNDK